jgi:hypothetical protein
MGRSQRSVAVALAGYWHRTSAAQILRRLAASTPQRIFDSPLFSDSFQSALFAGQVTFSSQLRTVAQVPGLTTQVLQA